MKHAWYPAFKLMCIFFFCLSNSKILNKRFVTLVNTRTDCCLPCNHCSIRTWVVEEILAFLVVGYVLSTAGSYLYETMQTRLPQLELLNYYLTLAMSSAD